MPVLALAGVFLLPTSAQADLNGYVRVVFVGTTDVLLEVAFWEQSDYYRSQRGPLTGRLLRNDRLLATVVEGPTPDPTTGAIRAAPVRLRDSGLTPGVPVTYQLLIDNSFYWCSVCQVGSAQATPGVLRGTVDRDYTIDGGSWTLSGNLVITRGATLRIAGGAEIQPPPGSLLLTGFLLDGGKLVVQDSTLRRLRIAEWGGSSVLSVERSVLDHVRFFGRAGLRDALAGGAPVPGPFSIERSTLDSVGFESENPFPITTFRGNHGTCGWVDTEQRERSDVRVSSRSSGGSIWFADNDLPGCLTTLTVFTDTERIVFTGNTIASLGIQPWWSATGFRASTTVDTVQVMSNTITGTLLLRDARGGFVVAGNEASDIEVWDWYTKTSDLVSRSEIRDNQTSNIDVRRAGAVVISDNEVDCRSMGGGLRVYSAPGTKVLSNTLTNCTGVAMLYSGEEGIGQETTVRGNVVTGTIRVGIEFVGLVEENEVVCWDPQAEQPSGILVESSDAQITWNRVRNCTYGIQISGETGSFLSRGNTVRGNVLISNTWGLRLKGIVQNYQIADNAIYTSTVPGAGGSVRNELTHVYCTGGTCTNTWSVPKQTGPNVLGGPFLGGNFYADFPTVDADADQLSDQPRRIDRANVDLLPLADSTVYVNSTGDEGDADPADRLCDVDPSTPGPQCTLRAAIEHTNRITGSKTIAFAIPASGVPIIRPGAQLPAIRGKLTIDASTQPGAARAALSGEGAGTVQAGLFMENGSLTIRSLTVSSFGGYGIRSAGSGTLVVENVEVLSNCGSGILAGGDVRLSGVIRIRQNGTGLGTCSGGDGIRSEQGSIRAQRARLVEISRNRDFGMASLGVGSDNLLENARIEKNGGGGVYVHAGPLTLSGTNNAIRGNEGHGVYSAGAAPGPKDVLVGGADISDNRGWGIWSRGLVDITSRAWINSNGDGGIRAVGSDVHAGDASLVEVRSNGYRAERPGEGIFAESVILRNTRVSDNAGYGIRVGSRLLNYVRLLGPDNEVSGNGSTGIHGGIGGSLEAGGLTVSDNGGWGVEIGGSILVDTKLRANGNRQGGLRSGEGAVQVSKGAGPVEITGNGKANPGSGHGIIASEGVWLWNASVRNNSGNGIKTSGPVQLRGGDNEVSGNTSTGIFNGGDVLADGLDVSRNGGWGIWSDGRLDVARWIRANQNARGGIRVSGEALRAALTGEAAVHEFEVIGNGSSDPTAGHGIQVLGGDVDLANARVLRNTGSGLYTNGLARVMGASNEFSGNGGNGIFSLGDRLEAHNLIANGNTRDGVRADSGTVRISNGVVYKNGGRGVFAASAMLDAVEVRENTGGGVVIATPVAAQGLRQGQGPARVGTLAASPSTIVRSDVISNTGDGIQYAGQGGLDVASTNVYGNSGYGVSNLAAGITITARSVWWGASPAQSLSGTVDASRPLTRQISLVAVSDQPAIALAPGAEGTISVSAQNWQNPTSTVRTSLSDELGWLQEPRTADLALQATAVVSQPFVIAVPATATVGTRDAVRVTVTSQTGPQAAESYTVTISVAGKTPLASVSVTGSITGYPNIGQLFWASLNPVTVTEPITWTWEATAQSPVVRVGDAQDGAAFTWPLAGTQRVTVTASNGAGAVRGSREITLLEVAAPISSPAYQMGIPVVLVELAGGSGW